MSRRLTISLVIPAYNEESYLADCLRSALAQQMPFDQIIVVDNNSTDRSAVIAASFAGVQVVRESRQGVVHARNRGFAAATNDIIARIDADTRLPTDWTVTVAQIFRDQTVAAVTGKVSYYDMALAQPLSLADTLLRRNVARLLGKDMALQGANMALRQTAWQTVRQQLCARSGVHEDFDLAIHLGESQQLVRYETRLTAAIAFRQAAGSWRQFASYYWHCPSSYLQHGLRRGLWLMPVATGMIIAFPLLHLLSRSYAKRNLSAPPLLRVNPATFVE